jgi:DNA invertase Pin-like site-specific DNA recombinase
MPNPSDQDAETMSSARRNESGSDLYETVSDLKGRDVGFASISESIDTTNPGGKLFFHT